MKKITGKILSEAIKSITGFLQENISLPQKIKKIREVNLANNEGEKILAHDFTVKENELEFAIRVFLEEDVDSQLKVEKIDRNEAINFASLSPDAKRMAIVGNSSGLDEDGVNVVHQSLKAIEGNESLIITYGMGGNEDGVNAAVNQFTANNNTKFVGLLSTDSSENDLEADKKYRFDAGILVISKEKSGGYHTTSWLNIYLSGENLLLVGGGDQSFREACFTLATHAKPCITVLTGLIQGIRAGEVFLQYSNAESESHTSLLTIVEESDLSVSGTRAGVDALKDNKIYSEKFRAALLDFNAFTVRPLRPL